MKEAIKPKERSKKKETVKICFAESGLQGENFAQVCVGMILWSMDSCLRRNEGEKFSPRRDGIYNENLTN